MGKSRKNEYKGKMEDHFRHESRIKMGEKVVQSKKKYKKPKYKNNFDEDQDFQ